MRYWALSSCLTASVLLLPAAPRTPFDGVRFEENRGQTDRQVRYLARARGYQVFLDAGGILLTPERGAPVRVSFGGAAAARWSAAGEPVERISYFIGNDAARWVKEAPVFSRITWKGLYPGVDLVVYGAAGERLEYDLVISPGADPRRVRLRTTGATRLSADGSIDIAGVLVQRPPVIYQRAVPGSVAKDGRRPVPGRFVAAGRNEFRLMLGGYDPKLPLVVDPVIEMLTYVGGENDDEIVVIGPYYVAGNTRSVGFPQALVERRRSRDVFFRYTAPGPISGRTGTIVFGGSDDDELAGVADARNGDIQLFGTTQSRDLPQAGRSAYAGGSSDGFVATISSRFFAFSTYLGGSGEDRITAASSDGFFIAVAGVTDSPDLPVTDGGQRGLAGGFDAFYGFGITSLSRVGYLGGPGDDRALAVAVTGSFELLVAGGTTSAEFPGGVTPPAGGSDGFLTRIRVFTPSPELRTTRFGGSGDDRVTAIARSLEDPNAFRFALDTNRIAVVGTTSSPDLPVRNAAQGAYGGATDAFAGSWDRVSGEFRWLSYAGGSEADEGAAVTMNWAGDISLGGWTRSPDLAAAGAIQPAPGGGEDGLLANYEAEGALRHMT